MNNDNEQENNGPYNRRKFIEELTDEPAEEPNTKKI